MWWQLLSRFLLAKIRIGSFFVSFLNQLQIVIVNLNELKIFVKSEKSNNKTFSFCVILIKVGRFGLINRGRRPVSERGKGAQPAGELWE